MFKTKKSKFYGIVILIIAGLLALSPLIITMNFLFGFNGIKNHTIEGDVDMSVTINVELRSSFANLVSYSYYVEFDFTHNSSVTTVEIEAINYQIDLNTEMIYHYNGLYWPNVYIIKNVELVFKDNLTCQGSVDLNYLLNSNPKNNTIYYNFDYAHNIREQDALNFVLSRNAIFFAYIASFFVLPIILYFIIHPDFYDPSKEDKEKNEEYFDFLEKRKQTEGDVNNNN